MPGRESTKYGSSCLKFASGASNFVEIPQMLGPRETALVGAYSPVERAESLGDDDVVLVTFKDSLNRRRLCFGKRGDFFDYHALSFALSASTARGQSNHPQRNDTLGVDAKLGSFKRYLKPRVEQGTPFVGEA
jgi:hypothetical protein